MHVGLSHILFVFAVPILTQSQHEDYFTWAIDCKRPCIILNHSCTISEAGNDFLCLCHESTGVCLQQATPELVCLRPGEIAVGGEGIWEKFKAKYHPDVTTAIPPVRPETKCRCLPWLIASATLSLLGLSVCSVKMLISLHGRKRAQRQGGHRRLSDGSPEPTGENGSPYRPTTTDIPEP